jgi:hypothetical protein
LSICSFGKGCDFFSENTWFALKPPTPSYFPLKISQNYKGLSQFLKFFAMQGRFGNKKEFGEFFPFIFLLKKNCEEKHVFKSVKCVFLAKNKYLSEKKKIPK